MLSKDWYIVYKKTEANDEWDQRLIYPNTNTLFVRAQSVSADSESNLILCHWEGNGFVSLRKECIIIPEEEGSNFWHWRFGRILGLKWNRGSFSWYISALAKEVKDTWALLALSGLLCLVSYPYLCNGRKINYLVFLKRREEALMLLNLLLPCIEVHAQPYCGRGWDPNFRISHGGESPYGPKETPRELWHPLLICPMWQMMNKPTSCPNWDRRNVTEGLYPHAHLQELPPSLKSYADSLE